MAFEGVKAKIKFLFKKNVFIADKINGKAQQCVSPARSCIAEGLQIHQPAKWGIEKINNGQDKIPGTVYMSSHWRDKVIETKSKCQNLS